MLKYAGLGIAMQNAREEIKAIADWVTLSNDCDGVAYAIEKWILNNE
jgi:hydroxymethylpyrimidine pyrophosphatase-like HAD family hydrolase